MATVYSKTDNYGLNLYGDNDPADLRDGYNGSMHTIDDTLEKHLNRIEGVESREAHDEEVVKALLGDNTVDSATAAKTKWDKSISAAAAATAAATAAANKADSNTAILAALGADNKANATASKTKWDKAGADAMTAIGKADNNKTILTALGAGSTTDATAQKTKLDNTAAKVDELADARVDSKLDSHFIIHAHRGSYRFPENTMEGIMWAVRHGYIPEIDVQLTSDGVPVILHDTSTARTMTGTAANVSSITYKDFMSREVKAKVHGGNTGKPVSMEQVLQAVGDSPVDFEIKSLTNETTDAMLKLLRKYSATAIHELTSFSWEQCVRAVRGGVKYVSWTWDVDAMPHSWTDMKNAGIFCGNPRENKLTSSMVSAAHTAGVKINPWLINDPVAYERVTALGVDGITSNWPDYASGQLERNFTPFSTGQNVFMRPNYAPQGGTVSQEISEAVRAKSSYLAPDGLFQLGDADSQMLVELVECGTVTLPVSIDLEGFESRVQIGENGETKNIAVIAVKESTPIGQFNDVATAGQVGIIAGVRRNGATFGGFYQDNVTTVAFDSTPAVSPSVPNDKSVGVHASFVLDRDHARIIWAYSNGQSGDVTTGKNKGVSLPDTDKYRLFVRLARNFKSVWKIRVRPTDGYLYES
jgi:glycerophosphoryl diester phosphodiesterase|nr:MAG TPA: GDPD protein [Caudoviricetes sp.]